MTTRPGQQGGQGGTPEVLGPEPVVLPRAAPEQAPVQAPEQPPEQTAAQAPEPSSGPVPEQTAAQAPEPGSDDGAVTDGFQLAGTPDGFERLWNPHRMAYVSKGQEQVTDESTCPFCAAPARSDEESLIVARGATAYVLCNLYPYNAGHLLVCPYRHVPDYTDLTVEETAELARLAQVSMVALRQTSSATGFNLGMNQGLTGGAGIAAHLHQHIVPRWGGDGNFLPIIAQTKNITVTLDTVRAAVAGAWSAAEAEFDARQARMAAGRTAAGRPEPGAGD